MPYVIPYSLFENYKIEDPKIQSEINIFYKLQNEIDELEDDLKTKKDQFKVFEADVKPILDAMKETKDKLGITEDYFVMVTKFGGTRTNNSYKDAFELALTKVNGATKKILQEALEVSKTVSEVKHSFEIQKGTVTESVFNDILSKLKGFVKSFLKLFKSETKIIDEGNKELEKLKSTL